MTPEAKVRNPSLKLVKKSYAGKVMHKRMHFGHGAANGWPDDLFVFHNGHHWWVEFKAPGKGPTKLQENTHNEIKAMHGDVSVIDNYAEFAHALRLRTQIHA